VVCDQVLLHVLRFLQALTHADNVPATKMTASNVALLFSPLLLRYAPPRCTAVHALACFAHLELFCFGSPLKP
jgi:hypothetical protein